MTAEFRLLGDIEARVDGRLVELGHLRQRSVVVILLVEANRIVPADQLVERVWAGRPPQRARDTLYGYVHRLRKALAVMTGVNILRQPGGYLISVDEAMIDVHRFRELVRQARATDDDSDAMALFDEALALWRGDPFAGVDTPWLNGVRDVLGKERFAAELDFTDLRLEHGQHTELVPALVSRASVHQWDERLAAQLMLALYRSGRQADALAHYEQTRTRLAEELGLDPSPALRQLHQRILTADPSLATPHATAEEPTPDTQLSRAARELATAVTRQWTAEAEIRSLHRPAPVRLRWSTTSRPVTGASEVLRGDISDVAEKFRALPVPQLVVLGEPGAGKTVLAILLTLGLLADRTPGDPTPVLLSLTSWNPRRDHLRTWLARRLLEEYPGLGNTKVYGHDAATRLVTDERVIPVLDGLDETPPGLHAAAIDALDQAIAGGRPLVVTCRANEYENAVRHGGILASAAVVEIEPVELDEAITFLTARHHPGDTRWQQVVDHLRRDGPLARALSTPLMVDLARTAYRDSESDPTELLDPQRFPDRATIEDHLLDAFLPAAYAQRPQPPGLPPSAVRNYAPDQAQRWLTFLAHHLQHLQTRDFAWWHLVRAIPRPMTGLVFSLPAACLFAIAGLLARGPALAWVYGLSTAVGGCAAQGWGTRSAPLRVEVRFQGTALPFLGRFAIGLVISVVIGVVWSLPIWPVLMLALAFGFGMGLHVWLEVPTEANRASSPATTHAQDRVATLAFALSVTVSIGLFYAFAISVSQPHSNLGAAVDPFHLARALPAGFVSALFGWFAFRYVGAVSYGLAGFVLGGQAMAHHIPLSLGLTAGAVFGLAIGLTTALSRSWGVHLLSRAWLALRGQTPMRLNRFLEDAHRRGVLRQTGALYQFRHARLHDRLAAKQSTKGTGRE
ncbi:MAG TPA: BTAD domain-containing putative transcriptional regulator [Amycolatopsis sp.]|uniref:BTAD domain-containing putative transcriptional regulator n=1 Tax=Amycolatopsis sp. TaxID=37632 RepID=UPI002B462BB3|nr:BTAD domain-containing putative transcriptional regulator [Amycolatopsis sp.]HKS45793.1 BTAD domain-containing putative transcriptional regulator [Amycolatopsis sp.]